MDFHIVRNNIPSTGYLRKTFVFYNEANSCALMINDSSVQVAQWFKLSPVTTTTYTNINTQCTMRVAYK